MLHPARLVQSVENDFPNDEPKNGDEVPAELTTEEPLTALAKANALMDIYFSD